MRHVIATDLERREWLGPFDLKRPAHRRHDLIVDPNLPKHGAVRQCNIEEPNARFIRPLNISEEPTLARTTKGRTTLKRPMSNMRLYTRYLSVRLRGYDQGWKCIANDEHPIYYDRRTSRRERSRNA